MAVGQPGWTARLRDFLTEVGEPVTPVSPVEIEAAERRAGTRLPAVVREMWQEVGDTFLGPHPPDLQPVEEWVRVLKFVTDLDGATAERLLGLTNEGVVLWDMKFESDFWVPSTGAVHRFDGDVAGTLVPLHRSIEEAIQMRLDDNFA